MSKVIIGVDPDSDKFGVALFEDGKLVYLSAKTALALVKFVDAMAVRRDEGDDVTFVIEDVIANGFMYSRNSQYSKAKNLRIAQNVGMCKQSQKMAEQIIKTHSFKLVRIPPQRSNFAKNKKLFESATGWTENSNEDMRSAAYFGLLYIDREKRFEQLEKEVT